MSEQINTQKVVEILKKSLEYWDQNEYWFEQTELAIIFLENETKKQQEDAKFPTRDLSLLHLCNALGWQGGTIHQVLAEIKKLKIDKERLVELLSKQVCDPDPVYNRKEIITENCGGCKSYEKCIILSEM